MEKIIKHRTTVTRTTTTVESPKSPKTPKSPNGLELQLKPLENSNLYQRRAHSKENLLFDTPSHQRYSANYDELPPTLDDGSNSEASWPKYLQTINNNNNNVSGSITSNSVDDEVVFRNERKNSADLLRLVCQIFFGRRVLLPFLSHTPDMCFLFF